MLAKRDRQTIGEERAEQVRFDPVGCLVKDGPQADVVLERAKRRLHVARLHPV